MTAPQRRASGFDANARGLAVLVVAVAIGFLLLLKAGGPGAADQSADRDNGTTVDTSGIGGDDTTTTAVDDTTTTSSEPTDETRDPGEVKVLVLNGSGLAGVAASNSATIGDKGYDMQTPSNASISPASTVVYFADGFQADAAAVAELLGKSSDVVSAMPAASPGAGADTADVVVVLGKDTAPAGNGTTTTTAAN